MRALGDPERTRDQERRWFRHSVDQPTGRFAQKSDRLTVSVPAGVTGLAIRIGQFGVYSALNGGKELEPSVQPLQPGVNSIVAPQDGLVSLQDTTPAGARTTHVVVTGGTAVPTFVKGSTTSSAFDAAVRASKAPFAVMIGDRVVAEMQRPTVLSELRAGTAEQQVAQLDRTVDLADASWGLSRSGPGQSGRPAQRVLIASPDRSGGYANATHGRVTFQVDTGAAGEILNGAPAAQWGFWHEVGHTYQPDFVNWEGLAESTVNITSLYVQQHLGFRNRLDDDERQPDVDAFFAQPAADRQFNDADGWVKLLMFDQLSRAFGEDFPARVGQADRVRAGLGDPGARTTSARMQRFASLAASVADRDLRPFFAQWGFALGDETTAQMEALPPLRHDIWTSRDSTTAARERTLTYNAPSASITASGSATIGQRVPGSALSARVSDVSGGKLVGTPRVVATSAGTGAGSVVQELVAPDGTPNLARTAIDVVHGDDVSMLGLGDAHLATVALDPASRALSVDSPAVHDPHPYFDGEYIGARYVRSDGTVVADASVAGKGESDGLGTALDGVRYENGDVLVLRHCEPSERLQRWTAGKPTAPSHEQSQAFRISADRLVPVPADEIPAERASADRIDLLGLGDQVDARIALSDGRITATMPWDHWTHDYFAGKQYLAARLVAADGTVLRSATARGDENAERLVATLNGTTTPNGTFLVIEHAEANDRLQALDGDTRIAKSADTTQAFRIGHDRFTPVALDTVPQAPASADRIDLLGLGDQVDARIALSDGRITATMPWDHWTHDYFAGRQYLAARLVAADGTVLRSATARGDENAERLVATLNGTTTPNGTFLVLEHAEANDRLQALDGDTRIAKSADTTQAFRIGHERFTPVALDTVPQ
ncbi:M60 family metallopeptidase [Curtobacterium flaccumfaciens]|uniref:M60 family metallopeptidase n=1 Tax=Curtobacterium flaccumfaciens TaxID=2035 RepID=UPI002659E6C4|nr:M60 family metallopeptidase [Curtobacterium flaccumfaciens]MCS5506574.1 M60 family metallopeptidase [Curtobacterium flaccumfaciens pv. flaccumfaciens]